MNTLTGRIERYIKDMIDLADADTLELKRKDLAEVFSCVPSQINYVLETRFRTEQGYQVISRRGAGGCFRIIRMEIPATRELEEVVKDKGSRGFSREEAEGFLSQLLREEIINTGEYMLILAMVCDDSLKLCSEKENKVRGSLLRSAVLTILRRDYR